MSSSGRNVLIVYAHPEPKSFNGALKDTAVEALTAAGFNVKVSDLYAMQFKATTSQDDILGAPKTQPFDYLRETKSAFQEKRISHDIVGEVEKMKWADLLILQFPIHWFGPPSMLKGWIDRVFVLGETFRFPDGLYNHGLFKGKRAVLSITTGGKQSLYEPTGIHGDMRIFTWPLENGCLNFLGYNVLKPHICYGILSATEEARKEMLQAWRKRVVNLFNEEPQVFFRLEDFTGHGFGAIKDEALEKARKSGSVAFGQSTGLSSEI